MKIKKNSFNVKSLILGIFIGLFFAGTFTFATALWHGTDWIEDGEVISAEMMKDNFDYLLSLFGDSCTENNIGQVRVDSSTLVTCNGEEWDVLDITINGGGCSNDSDAILGDEHTVGECNSAGGVPVSTEAGCLCQFGSSCAAGWTQHENWSTTASQFCVGVGSCQSCTTGSHEFSSTGVESCTYTTRRGRGCYSATCSATRTAIGCK